MQIAAAEKTEFSRYEIPLSEAKAKQWIDSLSSTDTGETTRRVFYGLIDFNRRIVPPAVRIRIAEYLRPKFDLLLLNLQRHLKSQSFPLPPRSQKISDLNQSLLLEYAGLYQLAALDMLNQDAERKKALQITVFRVVDYLGKYLLSSYSVYSRTGETVWRDIHHMYLLAVERGLEKLKVDHDLAGSIEERYLQMNLLALCKPYSLRQEEVLRLERFIRENIQLASLTKEPIEDELLGSFVHAVIMNNDEPAVIMPYGDLPHSPTVRVFNIRALVVKLDTLIDEIRYEHSATLILGNILSRNLAKRIIYHLTTVKNRQHSRSQRNEKIMVVMGMKPVHQVIERTLHQGKGDMQREEDLLFSNMLYGESVSEDDEAAGDPGGLSAEEKESGVRIWRVQNNSVGGYGLHWDSQDGSLAKVGELVGLRAMHEEDNPWMTGVVKWMEYLPKHGLSCGVELLSMETRICEVNKILNRQLNHTLPIEGLMLPAIEGLREEAVLILPAYIFIPGDELTIRYDDKEEKITLSVLDECLGTFSHFHFRASEKKAAVKAEESFDDLWDAL